MNPFSLQRGLQKYGSRLLNSRQVIRRQPIEYAGVSAITLTEDNGKYGVSKQTEHGLIDIAGGLDQVKAEEIFHRTVKECQSKSSAEREKKQNANKPISEIRKGMKVVCTSNPEWGVYVIDEKYHESWWRLKGRRQEMIRTEYELKRFWEEIV